MTEIKDFIGLSVEDPLVQYAIQQSIGGYIAILDGIVVDVDKSVEQLVLRVTENFAESLQVKQLAPTVTARIPNRQPGVFFVPIEGDLSQD